MEKRRNCSKGAISPLFHNIFNISLTLKVQLHIYLLNVVNRISFSPNSANLICRSTDISKYFRESLGIRDNESRLYILFTKVSVLVCRAEKVEEMLSHFFFRKKSRTKYHNIWAKIGCVL